MITTRRGPRLDWNAADFDSYEVLAATGATAPAARVTRARSAHPFRRAARSALRAIRPTAVHATDKEVGQ